MTTSTTTPRLSYTADGSTAAFTFNFEIADSSSIAVYEGATKKTLTTHYAVSFDSGTSGTGTVTFNSAPSSGTVTLIRDTNLARTTDFENSGAFLASTVNTEFDRLSQAVIDATDKIEQRAILLAEPNTETTTLTLPDAATRANKQISFDGSGELQVTLAGSGTISNIATGTGLTGGPITTTGTIAIDSTVATLTGSQTLTNKTLTTPIISSISNSGTVTLPTGSDTLVARATTDTLTNKTINSASNTITITESNISDLGSYITASSSDTLTNKGGNISQWTNNSGYIANTVEDTTPQLGGNLDLNSKVVNGTGTINITGDITGTNIRATGNLTVDGTTTTLNTQNLSIEDAFIELNRNNSSTSTGTDAGIFIRNGYTGAGTDYNPTLYWDHGDQKFRFMVTDVDPNTTVNLNDGSTTLANVAMGSLSSGPITAQASKFYGITFMNNNSDDALEINQNNITGLRSNDDINITPAGTGTVNISHLALASGVSVTSIKDEDSLSSNSDSALATQQSIKAYVDAGIGATALRFISQGDSNVTVTDAGTGAITIAADGNTVSTFNDAAGLTMSKNIAMGGNTITGLSTATPSADSDVAHKKYVDDSVNGFITAASTTTFTNKTFDANGSGNNISNIDIGNMTAASVVLEAEGIGSNDNDTTLPTSAAVKNYADSVAGIGNVVEDTTPQLGGNLDLNSNNITGTGDVSITGTIANEGISISGNNIRSTRSNDDVYIKANGTGRTVVEDVFYFAADYTFNSTSGSYIQMNTNGEIVLNPYLAGNVTIGETSGTVEETIQTFDCPLWLRAGKADNGSARIQINGSQATSGNQGFLYLVAGNDSQPSATHGRVEIQGTDSNQVYLQSETGKEFHITTRDSNKPIKLIPHGTGNAHLGNFVFDADQTVGAGQDNFVLTYDHSAGSISLEAGAGGVSLSGSTNNTIATVTGSNALAGEANLTFDGSTLAVTGAATVSTTLGVTGASTLDGITITDNTISTNASNADLVFGTNGTGRIGMSVDGSDFWNNPLYAEYYGDEDHVKTLGISRLETVDAGSAARNYMIGVAQNTTLSGSSSSNSNFRPRTFNLANSVDMAGYSYTKSGDSRGPKAGVFTTNVVNSGSSASTLQAAQGGRNYVAAYADTSTYAAGDLTVTNAIACSGEFEMYSGGGSGAFTFTNAFNFQARHYVDTGHTITNNYGFYYEAPTGSGTVTNQYAFYDASNSLSVFGDIQTQAVSIIDNCIKTNRSNDDLYFNGSGTGSVVMASNGGNFGNYSTNSRFGNANILYYQDLSDTIGDGNRAHKNMIVQDIKLAGSQNSNNSSDRWRNQGIVYLDMNGSSSTNASTSYRSRGPMGFEANATIENSTSTAVTLGNASGGNYGVSVYPTGTGNITLTGATGMGTYLDVAKGAGNIVMTDYVAYNSIGADIYVNAGSPGNFTVTDVYHYYARSNSENGGGTNTITNNYAFYADTESMATNKYAFYSANDAAKSRVGSLERYREEINALTNSTTITVDCDLAPVHTVTIAQAGTGFNLKNLATGQTVTLIVKQDGTGNRTATFTEEDSTAILFPGGQPTLSTAANSVDVLTFFNTGSEVLGNCTKAYAAS